MSLTTAPARQVTATYTTVLSQDVIQTDSILVDSDSASPVAPFRHPVTQVPEALVVSGGKLGHATRDATGESGWRLDPLGSDAGIPATAVAAGTNYKDAAPVQDPNDPARTVDQEATLGFFQDDTALHVMAFSKETATWSAPTQVAQQQHNHLRVAYSPRGKLVVFGTTPDGDLAVAYRPRPLDPVVWQRYSLKQPLSDDYALVVTDERNWTVAAEANGRLWLYYGLLDGTSSVPSSDEPADGYDGGVTQIVTGYWSDSQSSVFFVFVDDAGELKTWSRSQPANEAPPPATVTPVPATASQAKIAHAVGHVYDDPDTLDDTLHVYTIDTDSQLSVLHQRTDQPWHDDGSPAWAGMLPLDSQIARLAVDPSPSEAPSLFGLTLDKSALHLHAQDPTTRLWKKTEVHQSSEKSFDVTRHRVEVAFRDEYGAPVSNHPVTVALAAGSTATDICVGSKAYPLTARHDVALTTTATGKLTFAVLVTTGLAGPDLILDADGLERLTVHTSRGLHDYLAGNGTLNPTNPVDPDQGTGPLPVFDSSGKTLAGAQVSGKPLAPGASSGVAQVAAAAIQQTSMVGSGTTPPGVAGYAVHRSGDGLAFTTFNSTEELQAHLASRQVAADAAMVGLWAGVDDFFGDIWEGIKNGAIEVAEFVVHVADKVATLTLKIADEIEHAVTLALDSLEKAAHLMAGVFQMVGALIEKVIDWLKALFDFGSIWRTKMVFERALLAAPGYVKAVAERAEQRVDGWFAAQEAAVHQVFDQAKSQFGGQTVGGQPGYQAPGVPDATTKVAGGAAAADFTDNAHHNWLHDKVDSAMGAHNVTLAAVAEVDSPWNNFRDNTAGALHDFEDALQHLQDLLWTLVEDPKSITTTGVVDLLTIVEDVVDGVLRLADGVFDAFLALLEGVMDGLVAMLDTPLDVPLLPALWKWLATSAGYPDDDRLTLGALIALLGAFPTTILYKLIAGVSTEPFPATEPQTPRIAPMSSGWSNPLPWFTPPPESVLASTILALVGAGFATASDAIKPTPPTWISLVSFGITAVTFATGVGFPDPTQINGLLEDTGIVVVGMWVGLLALKGCLPTISNDAINIVFCGFGVLSFLGHLGYNIYNKKDAAQFVGGLFTPLPNVFSFLNLEANYTDPIRGAAALIGKLAVDVLGYLTGGIAYLVDAAEVVAKRHRALA